MAKAHKKPLKNSLRLKKRRDFLRLQHIGVRQVMAHFILQAGKAPDPISGSRFGFTASKKIGNPPYNLLVGLVGRAHLGKRRAGWLVLGLVGAILALLGCFVLLVS